MKGKQVVSGNEREINHAKVIGAYLKNPNASVREVASAVNVPKSTVHYLKANIGQIGLEEEIQGILNRDKAIIELAQNKLISVLNGEELPKYGGELSSVVSALSDSTKRTQLFSGKPTERVAFDDITDEQLERVLARRNDINT